MKRLFLLLLVSVGVFAFSNTAQASHAAGGEVLYEHITGNTYKIIFKFYRDCNGINAPASGQVCYESAGCSPNPFPASTLTLPKVSGPTVVSNGCPNFGNSCNSSSSPIPGYEEHVYETTVTLPPCNFWRFWVYVGARNQMDWLSGGTLVIDATFNNSTAATTPDNSPYFSVKPVPYCCVGVPFTFNNGAVDINGDSLVYESVNPLTGQSCNPWSPQNSTYQGFPVGQTGNPLTNPIPTGNTFTLNSQTGAIAFTPTNAGTGVITIKCTSYRNGQLIGFVKRDIQVVVVANCSPGLVPTPPVDSLSLVNAGLDSLGQVAACSGDSLAFCFNVGSSDTDAVLVPYSNILASMPGATITYTGTLTDSIRACVNWQTSQADTGLHVLVLTLIDSSCKPPGILHTYTFTIPVFVDYGIEAFGDTIICAGDSAPLAVIGGGAKSWSVLPGGSPITSLSCTQCDNPIASPTVPTYYVAEGCDLDTVFVDVVQIPVLTVTPRTTTCVNANLQLNVAATPGSQQFTYLWASSTPNNFLSATNIANPVVQNPDPAATNSITYTVTVQPINSNNVPMQACESSSSVIVDILKGFSIDPYDTVLCDGESTTITGTGTTAGLTPDAYSYNWTPIGDMTPNNTLNTVITPAVPGGSYTITASFPGCPDSSVTLPVIVDELPVVDAGPDREMCLNDTIHLNSSVIPNTANYYTITWTPGADMNSSAIADPVYRGKLTQTLNVVYTTPNGCEDNDNVLITVNNVDFLQLNGDRTLCPGDSATLTVLGGLSYVWSPDYFISNTGNVTSVRVYPQATQRYQVIGIDNKGCFDTAYATVIVNPGSVVDAGEDVTIYPGERVTLYADGNCSLFEWFPPSGLSATKVKNPVAQPTATTRYYVNAETENGCPTMDSVTVIVSNESLIDLPNAFSPGSGTSINDKLMIRYRGEVTLKRWDIFNRWGQKVFSTNSINEGWNGQFKNEPQPLGAYVYMIEAETSTGKRFYKQGNVTLIR